MSLCVKSLAAATMPRSSFRPVAAGFLAPLFLSVAAVLGGCQMAAAVPDDGVAAVQFQDVVVPAGLLLRDKAHESHSREEAGWRQGRFVYQGSTPIEEAIAYVRLRMPQHSWSNAEAEAGEASGTRLRFERGIYSADYTFDRRDGVTQMVVDYNTDYSRR